MKYLCFRFDVDTHKCLRDGVPNLLTLAESYNIKFTFFINPGKSIDRRDYLRGKVKKLEEKEPVKLFSAFKKLGMKDYIYAALCNPSIAQSYPHIIKSIFENGHEIGLHGGKNHQLWHTLAHTWTSSQIEKEIMWGKMQLQKIINNFSPNGFASPGWNGSAKINKVLQRNGFSYSADIHTNKPLQTVKSNGQFTSVPTNVTGEPGGVGYIEHCRALLMNDDEIVADFANKLKQRKRFAVMYDHPYYVGVQELPLLHKLIKKGIEMKYTFVNLDYISKNL